LLQHGFHCGGNATQGFELAFVRRELGCIRKFAVHEQVRDLLELGRGREIQDVIAAIMQVIAGAADRT